MEGQNREENFGTGSGMTVDVTEKRVKTLSKIGVGSIYKVYTFVKILLIIFATLCVIGGIVLLATSTETYTTYVGYGYRYYTTTETNYTFIGIGAAMLVAGPLFSFLTWFILKPVFAFLYDVKVIRYKLFENDAEKTESIKTLVDLNEPRNAVENVSSET